MNDVKILTFSPEERAEISALLADKFSLQDETTRDEIISGIETTGTHWAFSYGSHIKNPTPGDQKPPVNATAPGYAARFNCAHRFYGATHSFPSLMLGLEPSESGSAHGTVSQKNAFGGNPPSARTAIDYLSGIEASENAPGNYKYRSPFLRVIPDGMTPVLAAACVSDPDSPIYVGNKLTDEEKAILIANEWGPQLDRGANLKLIPGSVQNPYRKTIYGYFTEFMDARIKRGLPHDPELDRMLQLVNHYRETMNEDKRLFLEFLESGIGDQSHEDFEQEIDTLITQATLSETFRLARQNRRELDPGVFEAASDMPSLSPEQYLAQLHSARVKMREALGMDPHVPEKKDLIIDPAEHVRGATSLNELRP